MVTKLAIWASESLVSNRATESHLSCRYSRIRRFTLHRWSNLGLWRRARCASRLFASHRVSLTVSSPREERYICWYCWRTFRYPNSLKAHLRFHRAQQRRGRAYFRTTSTWPAGQRRPGCGWPSPFPETPASDFAAAAPASTLRPHSVGPTGLRAWSAGASSARPPPRPPPRHRPWPSAGRPEGKRAA